MKHCEHCGKAFDVSEIRRPACGGALRETDDTGEIAAIMLLIGLL